jgi:hypothetical protein
MRIVSTGAARHVTRAEWDALREQCERARAETARISREARRATSEAMEQRLRFEHVRLDARRPR